MQKSKSAGIYADCGRLFHENVLATTVCLRRLAVVTCLANDNLIPVAPKM